MMFRNAFANVALSYTRTATLTDAGFRHAEFVSGDVTFSLPDTAIWRAIGTGFRPGPGLHDPFPQPARKG